MDKKWTSKYFFGNEISSYGLENKRVDYATLAKAFDAVLCNNIPQADPSIFENIVSGSFERYEDTNGNIYDYTEAQDKIEELQAVVDDIADCITNDTDPSEYLYKDDYEYSHETIEELEQDIDALECPNKQDIYQFYLVSDNAKDPLEMANEIIFYSELLDCYVWGVTHFGTSWSYVLTDIEIDLENN